MLTLSPAVRVLACPLCRFLTEASSSRSSAGREDGTSRVWQVLAHAPYLVPFADRARLFQLMVGKEREVSGGTRRRGGWLGGAHKTKAEGCICRRAAA